MEFGLKKKRRSDMNLLTFLLAIAASVLAGYRLVALVEAWVWVVKLVLERRKG